MMMILLVALVAMIAVGLLIGRKGVAVVALLLFAVYLIGHF